MYIQEFVLFCYLKPLFLICFSREIGFLNSSLFVHNSRKLLSLGEEVQSAGR